MKDVSSSKRRKKKSGSEAKPASIINLVTAILNLIIAILLLLDHITK